MTPEDDAEYRANTAATLRHLAELVEADDSSVHGVALAWVDPRGGGSIYLTFLNVEPRDGWVLIGQTMGMATNLASQINAGAASPISVLNPKVQA